MRTPLVAFALSVGAVFAGCTASSSSPAPVAGTTGTSPVPTDPTPTTTATTPAPKPTGTAQPPVTDPQDRGTGCLALTSTVDFWAQQAKTLVTELPSAMCNFQGSVVLAVNVASYCGYTPQYTPLEALYQKYKAGGLVVMGFPSKSFNQEKDTGAEISTFCTTEYHITFPMFAIGDVAGAKKQPVYAWIATQPGFTADVSWNFEKFLVSRKGKVVGRYLSAIEPSDATLAAAIEAELAKPK